ncbi:hypothetical protein AOQ84DRAFT_159410 [Glonium stellatum]|uniref:Uncharacterized protein n=1 Tax=Glonium stellatum TaxID=574774 RepID=A0A8E2F8B4_9PEZI|nr:hypothetical protein AOQ84DRAFT_159410 [Glonium stellatum]
MSIATVTQNCCSALRRGPNQENDKSKSHAHYVPVVCFILWLLIVLPSIKTKGIATTNAIISCQRQRRNAS